MSKRKTKTKAEKKARVAKFKAQTISENNRLLKMEKDRVSKLVETQAIYRRISIIEHIYKNNPKLGIDVNGKNIVNMEVVYEKDGILYWTSDDNPIIAGLDSFENYSEYTIEFIERVFLIIKMRNIEKQLIESENKNDEGIEFELVESDIEVITPEAI